MIVLPKEFEKDIRQMMEAAEREAAAKEAAEIAVGKRMTNGPLARMLLPLQDCNDPLARITPGEHVLIHTEQGLKTMRLVQGLTRYLDSRRQWSIFERIRRALEDGGFWINDGVIPQESYETSHPEPGIKLTPEQIDLLMHGLFLYTYGVMAVCRHYDDQGESHLFMGIRGAKLASLNVGQLSFPAGMVNPYATLDEALLAEFSEETGLTPWSAYPGWVEFRFPNACSRTFGRLMETRASQPKKCWEVKGGLFTLVPEKALRQALIDHDNSALVAALNAAGVGCDQTLKVTNDGTEVYLRLSKIYPA